MNRIFDLETRSCEAELMDREDIGFEEFHHCLRSLELINRLTLAYRPTLCWLRPFLRSGRVLRILDVGSGGGDMLRAIERLAKNEGNRNLQLIGVDLNPWSRRSAQLSAPGSSIRFVTDDVFSFEPGRPADLIVCSLFTHHLSDGKVVDFLRWLNTHANLGWFINDLHRHPVPYHFIKLATACFSRNRLIRNDAAVSVARSFTVADWQRLLQRANLGGRIRIERHFPFRICVCGSTA